ncbi:hypothetical protein [Candidatus Jidaibacter acanthamoebae]|nr:hypothetical protein [Candidatus Jidaibacter acanthamoeba]
MKGILRKPVFDPVDALKKVNAYCKAMKCYVSNGVYEKEELNERHSAFLDILRIIFLRNSEGVSYEKTKNEITMGRYLTLQEPRFYKVIETMDVLGNLLEGKDTHNIFFPDISKDTIQKITRMAILMNLPEGKEVKSKLEERHLNHKPELGKHTARVSDPKEKKVSFNLTK